MNPDRPPAGAGSPCINDLLEQYGCGPIRFTGTSDALYERHLMFDNVVDSASVGWRERYEACARSVRDVLSQRWLRTEQTYARENPKRVYYLSMEFLIGRSLANNVLNLLLDPIARRLIEEKRLDPLALLEQEPDAGLGNGGLGRLAACFVDSMATMQLPAMGYGLRYEYGIFRQAIADGWQREQPDNWLRRPDPWEVARPQETVEVKLGCSFEVRGGTLGVIVGRPSSVIGVPFDRPVVGYGGKTINTLRLWAAAVARRLRLPGVQPRRVRRRAGRTARGRVADAGALSRRHHEHGPGSALRAGVFPRRLFAGGHRAAVPRGPTPTGSSCPDKVAIQLNDTHPSLAVPELMRILLDEAGLGWDAGLGPHEADAGLHQPHAAARGAGEMAGRVVRDAAAAAAGDHLRDQPPPARRGAARAFPATRGALQRVSLIEEERRAQDPHGQPRHRRLAQHQRRGRDPLPPAAHDDGQGPGGDVPRAVQQQDQRRHAAALAAAGQPAAGPDRSPRPSATAGSRTSTQLGEAQAARRGQRPFAPRFRKAKRDAKAALRRLAEGDIRRHAWTRSRSSTARSSASTNTSGNC